MRRRIRETGNDAGQHRRETGTTETLKCRKSARIRTVGLAAVAGPSAVRRPQLHKEK
jgi:hypothetical protein